MRKTLLSLVTLLCPITASVTACNGDDSAAPLNDAGGDAGNADVTSPPVVDGTAPSPDAASTPDATTGDSGGSDTGSVDGGSDASDSGFDAGPHGLVRIAWFDDPAYVPALGGSRFDVCIAPHGSGAWSGPLLANAGGGGLGLGDVTTYFGVKPGQYDARIMTYAAGGGTPSCDPPPPVDAGAADAGDDAATDAGSDAGVDAGSATPVTDFTNLPAIADGAAFTLVFTPPFTSTTPGAIADLSALADETATTPGKVGVRFANVAGPAGATGLDYGLGGGVTFVPWFTGITSTEKLDPAADTQGYRQEDAFQQIDTSLVQAGAEIGVGNGIDAVGGSHISAFAVLTAQAGGGAVAGLVACADETQSQSSPLLTACNPVSVVSPGTQPSGVLTRFADFIADKSFPAVDVCIKYASQSAWTGRPILDSDGDDAGATGLVAGQVSKRFPIHEGFLYDVRVVAAGAGTCASAMTPDVNYEPVSTSSDLVTFAFTGYDAPPEDAGVLRSDAGSVSGGLSDVFFAGLPFDDLACSSDIANAPVVRVVNVAGGDPQPLTATLGGGSGWTFANVPYGGFVTTVSKDVCGYEEVASETGGVLSIAGSRWTYDIGTTATDTLYVYATGGSGDALNVVACDDGTSGECAALVPVP